MSETKFTKGPMTIEGPSDGSTPDDNGGDYAIVADGCIIGEAFHSVETGEVRDARANACLWSTSSEMYEALGVVEAYCPVAAQDMIRALRAKARGEEAT